MEMENKALYVRLRKFSAGQKLTDTGFALALVPSAGTYNDAMPAGTIIGDATVRWQLLVSAAGEKDAGVFHVRAGI